MKGPTTMTDDQERRIAELAARRSSPKTVTSTRGAPKRKTHKAKKSRVLALGLSVAAASGLVSGMWTQAAVAADSAAPADAPSTSDVALQPVVVPGQPGQPDQVVYLVVRRPPSNAGAESLRSTSDEPQPAATVPNPSVLPQRKTPVPAPVTRSHGSR
jgi:hypothetical protein